MNKNRTLPMLAILMAAPLLALSVATPAGALPSGVDASVIAVALTECSPTAASAQAAAASLDSDATASANGNTNNGNGAVAQAAAANAASGANSASASATARFAGLTFTASSNCNDAPPNGTGNPPDVDAVRFGCTTRDMGDQSVAYDGEVHRDQEGGLWFVGTRTVGGDSESYVAPANENGFRFEANPGDVELDNEFTLPDVDTGSFTSAAPQWSATGKTLHAAFVPSFTVGKVRARDVCSAHSGWSEAVA